MKKVVVCLIVIMVILVSLSGIANADPLFFDNFENGASILWGDEIGKWRVENGVYDASEPSNFPLTYTSLPYNLRNFVIELDMIDAGDGGIFLRGQSVLLVIGGALTDYEFNGMYFHTPDGVLGLTKGLFTPGDNLHIKIEVSGDTYSAFLYAESGTLLHNVSITTNAGYSGPVALYDNGPNLMGMNEDLKFDNVSVTGNPVPVLPTLWLLGSGLLGLSVWGRFRQG